MPHVQYLVAALASVLEYSPAILPPILRFCIFSSVLDLTPVLSLV
jgi:hypothetical protein